MLRIFIGLVVIALSACSSDERNEASEGIYDPVVADPVLVDQQHPPALDSLRLLSDGAHLNNRLFLANGPGPHPTVVFLHGSPGSASDMDLIHAVRRQGFNVLFFHYRGAWGSDGKFSANNALADTAAVVDTLRSQHLGHDMRVDTSNIILVGHSFGGFNALINAARDPEIACVAALAPSDLSVTASGLDDPQQAARYAARMDQLRVLDAIPGEAIVTEILDHQAEFSVAALAPKLSGKSVLLLAAKGDQVLPNDIYHQPAVNAFSANGKIALTHGVLDGDHSFSWSRVELARRVTQWLGSYCR